MTKETKKNFYYNMLLDESADEIGSLQVALGVAVERGDADAICKLSESLAKIKQNAMLVACNMNAIILKALPNSGASSEADALKAIEAMRKAMVDAIKQ